MNDTGPSDSELLYAIRKGDEKAFTALVKRYWKQVHAMTHARIRCVDATQEIVQTIFITIWNKRETLQINHLHSYLYAATKNRVLNYLESILTEKRHWEYYKQFIPRQACVTEHDVDMSQMMEALEDGVGQLPEKSRQIFKLHQLEGHSVSDIANSLKLSEKAIQYHLTQSTKRLRLYLRDYLL